MAKKRRQQKQAQNKQKFSKKHTWFLLAFILFVTVLAYLPSLNGEFTNWDDPKYITNNQAINSLSWEGLQKIATVKIAANYHPVTILSLAIDYFFWEYNTTGYHLTNLLFHLLATVGVFFFILELSNKRWRIAAITALFFAIHPMHVESVAWISERKDVLYATFFMFGLLAYLKYLRTSHLRLYFLAFILFLLSVLSKPAAVVFSPVLLLLYFYEKEKITIRNILITSPFFLVSLFFGLLTFSIQSEFGAVGAVEIYTPLQKLFFSSYGLLVYWGKFFVPINLSTFYSVPNVAEMPSIFKAAPVIVAGIVGAVYALFKKSKTAVFGSLFFFVTIVLVLQFISVGNALLSERYTYIPYIGLTFMIATFYNTQVETKKKQVPIYTGIFVLFALVFSVLTFQQTKTWKNSENLWTQVIKNNPNTSVGYYNRAHYYGTHNLPNKAIPDYSRAMAIKPNYYEAAYNRAKAYEEIKDYRKAIDDYTLAASFKTNIADPYVNRAKNYLEIGEFQKALADYQKALAILPDDYLALMGVGNALFKLKAYQQSIEIYEQLVEKFPDREDVYFNRSIVYSNMGEFRKADTDLKKAQELGKTVTEEYLVWLKEMLDKFGDKAK